MVWASFIRSLPGRRKELKWMNLSELMMLWIGDGQPFHCDLDEKHPVDHLAIRKDRPTRILVLSEPGKIEFRMNICVSSGTYLRLTVIQSASIGKSAGANMHTLSMVQFHSGNVAHIIKIYRFSFGEGHRGKHTRCQWLMHCHSGSVADIAIDLLVFHRFFKNLKNTTFYIEQKSTPQAKAQWAM